MLKSCRAWPLVAAILLAAPLQAAEPQQSQAFGPGVTVCGRPVDPPIAQPPANSPPVLYLLVPCFEAQGNVTHVEMETYLYYIQLNPSAPSQGVWVPWDEESQRIIRDDFRRLWDRGFLDDLKIEAVDYTFANGVMGKIVIYHMEERQRVKMVDYTGSKKLDTSQLDERLRAANAQVRLDSFIDDAVVRRAETVLRDMMREKGYQYSEITHKVDEIPGGPKLVHLTFDVVEGPHVKIKRIEFVGNTAVTDDKLQDQIKHNKPRQFYSFITGGGSYHEERFPEDAERINEYYRMNGYVRASIGEPEVVPLGDSSDGKTRWVELRIPVVEGERYKIGELTFEGNTVIRTEGLRALFDIRPGEFYNNKKVRDGYLRAKELYGTGGYWEFSGYPDFKFHDDPENGAARGPNAPPPGAEAAGPAVVDVTLRIQEGKQFFVNRITFAGNTTTRGG
jgi:outer membrane protein insertion porin family